MAPITEAPKHLRLTAEDRTAIEVAIRRVFFSTSADVEAAEIAEAAHLRRGEAANLSPDTVRRTVWIEATAEVLTDLRRKCGRLLPYNEAEELAADVLERELIAGAEAGRRNCVRVHRLTAAYLKFTAKDWATGREASRLEELTFSDDDESLAEAAPETPAEEDIGPDDLTGSETDHLYRLAATVARRLWIVPNRSVVYALAAALSDAPARELAEAWGVGLATWKAEASRGAAEIRATYPDPTDLVTSLLAEDRAVCHRETPLAARRIGSPVPDIGRHRTAGQMAREADWLLAAAQLPGRKATASNRTDGRWRTDVEAGEVAERIDRGFFPAGHRHTVPTAGPNYRPAANRGPRPHRAASHAGAVGADKRTPTAEREAAGWSRLAEGSRSTLDPRTHLRPTYSHTSTAAACWPTVRFTARTVAQRTYPQPAAAEDFTRYPITRREVWRMVWTAPRHRPTVLLVPSLDCAAAGEIQREHERPFSMVEDMAATAA